MTPGSWSKFFRGIWRVNALAIFALVSLGLIGFLISFSSGLFRSSHRDQGVPQDLAPKEAGKPELRIGQFERIGSSPVIRAELRELDGGSFSIKGGRSIAHNILFIDTNEGKSWWLLPTSDSAISEDREVSFAHNNTEISLGRVYLIESSVQGGDSQTTLMLTDPKGIKQVILAKGAVLIDELLTFSPEEARLLYHDKTGYHLTYINPTETKVIKDSMVQIAFPPRQ